MKDSKNKPPLLIVTTSFPRYSGDSDGNFIYELSTNLNKFYTVHVVAPMEKGLKKFEVLGNTQISRHSQFPFDIAGIAYGDGIVPNLKRNPFLYFTVPFFIFFQFIKIIQLIKSKNIELINAHWIPCGVTTILYKKLINSKVKVVVTIHGTDYWGFSNSISAIFKNFVLNNADALIVVSEPIKTSLLEKGCKTPISVCPMGTDTDTFSRKNSDPDFVKEIKNTSEDKIILFVGRLIKEKGVYTLIDSFSKIVTQIQNVKLVFVGEGKLKAELITYCNDLHLENKVVFAGKVPHSLIPQYFNCSDIFVLPSFSEGFPLVVMEALSCGTPSVVTNLPVYKTLESDDGVLKVFKAGDSEELAEIIERTLGKSSEETVSLKNKCREFALQNFSWTVIADRYKQILNNI